MTDLNLLVGLRIVVVGLGREGQALTTYLANRQLPVTATDTRPKEELAAASALEELGVRLVLGEHPTSLLDEADLLFVSPGVPLENPFLEEAQSRKISLSTESRLFCHLCPAPIIGVTGSSGKTTTTTLLSKILEADGRTTWLGGNIGRPLISVVDQMTPDDIVVMELSSFQLEYFHHRLNQAVDVTALPSADTGQLAALLESWSPSIGAILNITPNHLDRHPNMKHYVRSKRAVIDYQNTDQRHLVMSLDNDMTRTIGNQFDSGVHWFSLEAQPPGGAGIQGKDLVLFDQEGESRKLISKQDIKLRGAHNWSNILAACLMADGVGASIEAMQQAITNFTGVEHRLELVKQHQGVSYYNDSIATSPERVIAAIHSFDEPIVLLAGGRDKQLPWEDAVRLIFHKVRDLVLFGEAAPLINKTIERVRVDMPQATLNVRQVENLELAVQLSAQIAQPGDAVLLSPGCASFDQFSSYVERGQQFRSLVKQLK